MSAAFTVSILTHLSGDLTAASIIHCARLFAVNISYSLTGCAARRAAAERVFSASSVLHVTISLSRARVSATYNTRASSSVSPSLTDAQSAAFSGETGSLVPVLSYGSMAAQPFFITSFADEDFAENAESVSHRKHTGNSSPFEWWIVIIFTLSADFGALPGSFSPVIASRCLTRSCRPPPRRATDAA